ncbi:hypothetical protein [Phenylobacterium sp.]|uniref:hypothetical protein n=1 Tax=Phenylobacterium sp. TaxID=1871053 RepID=UPI002ED8826B
MTTTEVRSGGFDPQDDVVAHAEILYLPGPARPGGDLPAAWSSEGEGFVASLFSVRPLGSGWRLQSDGLEPIVFARGGHAERQARRLAACIARLGRDARVNVYDAHDQLTGSISYFGCRAPPRPDASARYPWAY